MRTITRLQIAINKPVATKPEGRLEVVSMRERGPEFENETAITIAYTFPSQSAQLGLPGFSAPACNTTVSFVVIVWDPLGKWSPDDADFVGFVHWRARRAANASIPISTYDVSSQRR